jgi:beta-galactosidase GanA
MTSCDRRVEILSRQITRTVWITCTAACLLAASVVFPQSNPIPNPPRIEKRGAATQLIVGGKPFLILGGELGNNAATTLESARAIWPRLVSMNLNAALVALSWAQIEPEEGKFDWTLVDGLIQDARQNNLRLVFLWFGSWKNTWSSYAPDWIKRDYKRFFRVILKDGTATERLSPFSDANRDADARAYAALLRHIREIDSETQTVIMMQVENEVGVIPDARDYSPVANEAYGKPVPKELMDYLQKHKETLISDLRDRWQAAGSRTAGSWEDIFGKDPVTQDFFMAWHYARYIGKVAEAGKREYNLPAFTNAALIRPGYAPGQYNSGGPLSHSMDIWRAGAPQLDFLAPDIYFNFKEWAAEYDRPGNPLFIPEARGGADGAANAFYAFGHHNALGFSPFAIEGFGSTSATVNPMTASYDVLSQLAPMILEYQAKGNGMDAVLLEELTPSQRIRVGDYTLEVTGTTPVRRTAVPAPGQGGVITGDEVSPPHGIFFAVGPNEFIMAGRGLSVKFRPETSGPAIVGLGTVQEGRFANGKWIFSRQLGGDDTGQGTSLTLRGNERGPGILRVTLYRYE